MNIAFIIHSMSNGGAERVVASLSNYFSSIGHNVTILTQTSNECFYALDKRIKIYNICDKENSGFRGYLERAFYIRKFIKNIKIDIAISFMTSSNISLSMASMGLDCKVYGSERTYPPLHKIPKKLQLLRNVFYRFLDAIIVQTNDTKEWFDNNVITKSVIVIPNPVNYPLCDTRPIVDVPIRRSGRRIIVSVGRLVSSKGHAKLIQTFSDYSESIPNADLYILGDGKEYDALKKMVFSYSLQDRVFIIGRVGNISDWYKFSDVFVMASEYEGFPNVLLEAMSFGLPSVVMDCHSGPRDIIDGRNGILVSMNDYDALWNSVSLILNDKNKYEDISMNAKEVIRKYNMESIGAQWLSL
ncbi:glycosyltransferase family 4 protein [Aeromonas allosaccharophila]|uniref:glycosyltransferase family 4 protein n=1 Tax=Aeromonas allosaccharophila TaxID=656 RepID=UPI003D24C466